MLYNITELLSTGQFKIHPNLSPYVVMGPGRCGSSFICEILEKVYNISMCEIHSIPSEWTPRGSYECLSLVRIFERNENGEDSRETFVSKINDYIIRRSMMVPRWGFKDLARFGSMWLWIKTPRIVFCDRPKELVMKSLIKKRGPQYNESNEEVEALYNRRMDYAKKAMEYFKGNHVSISFSGDKRTTQEEVCNILENKWSDINEQPKPKIHV